VQRDNILRTTVPYFWGSGYKIWPGEEIFLLPTVKCPYTRFLNLHGVADRFPVLVMCCVAPLGGGKRTWPDRTVVAERRTLITERISKMSQKNGQIKCRYHTTNAGTTPQMPVSHHKCRYHTTNTGITPQMPVSHYKCRYHTTNQVMISFFPCVCYFIITYHPAIQYSLCNIQNSCRHF
jgi:hypothetical protein